MCVQSVRCQLALGKPAETVNCSAEFELDYFFLTKAKVLCQMFRVFLQFLFLVRPFGFSLFDFFPKTGKAPFFTSFRKGTSEEIHFIRKRRQRKLRHRPPKWSVIRYFTDFLLLPYTAIVTTPKLKTKSRAIQRPIMLLSPV